MSAAAAAAVAPASTSVAALQSAIRLVIKDHDDRSPSATPPAVGARHRAASGDGYEKKGAGASVVINFTEVRMAAPRAAHAREARARLPKCRNETVFPWVVFGAGSAVVLVGMGAFGWGLCTLEPLASALWTNAAALVATGSGMSVWAHGRLDQLAVWPLCG